MPSSLIVVATMCTQVREAAAGLLCAASGANAFLLNFKDVVDKYPPATRKTGCVFFSGAFVLLFCVPLGARFEIIPHAG